MLSITPVRERISERFPVASFVVSCPPDRYFEVACATDARLFRADQRHRRTPANFTTSRIGGLLRAPAGQATYIIPPAQLRRFAGAQRLYYAVGSYTGPRNEDPVLTLPIDRVERAPSIMIAPDFTGRSLDRRTIGQAEARYGAADAPVLAWGGDDLAPAAPPPRLGNPAPAAAPAAGLDYDDGFDASLWAEPQHVPDEDPDGEPDADADDGGEAYGGRGRWSGAEPDGFEDAAAYLLGATEPDGFEDAAALSPGGGAWRGALAEPDGFEDLPARDHAYGSRRADRAAPAASAASRYGNPAPRAPHHERYGSAGRAAYGQATLAGYGDAEAVGYEDLPDLVRNLGPRRAAHARAYGNGAAALPAPVPAGAPIDAGPSALAPRFPDYSDELAVAEPLPESAPPLDPDLAFTPSDPRHRLRILGRVAQAESGAERYRAVATDAASGLAWGYLPFAQGHGGLGHLLRVCLRRDRAAYVRLFGEHNAAPATDDLDLAALPAGNLLKVTNAEDPAARLAPVVPPAGGAPIALAQAPWPEVFRAAGEVQAFQEAQREVADRRCYLPFLDFLRWLGIRSARGHAMFVDRAAQMGGGAAARWFARVVGPIRSQADLHLALAHLGHADLRSFQAAPGVPGVTAPAVDGIFGALSHAALAAALRHAVDAPLPLRTEPEMLAALCADAEDRATAQPMWRIAARRLRALTDDPALVHVPGVEAGR